MKNNYPRHQAQQASSPTTTKSTVSNIPLKESGIPWLGKIPQHWQVRRLKNVAKINNGATPSTSVKEFWNGEIIWITPAEINNITYIQNSERKLSQKGYKSCGTHLVPINSIIVTSRAPIGKVAIAKKQLCTNQGCKSLVPSNVYHLFLYYYLVSKNSILNKLGQGTTFKELRNYELGNLHLPLPPKAEQVAIAGYLDRQCEKIANFIQRKQTFITLLKEQRSALINKVVTKGINPNTPLKDSGIPWLTAIPQHWEVWRLRHICKITTGNKNTEHKVDNGSYPFYVRSQKVERINTYSFDGVGILTAGDGDIGKIFHLVNGKIDFHQRVYLFYEIVNKISPEFLIYYLKYNLIKDLMRYNAKSTVNSVRLPILKSFKVIVPPKAEQEKIVAYIKAETGKIDRAMAKATKEIALMQEYKEAMIAEAVLGKLNHRIMGSCS